MSVPLAGRVNWASETQQSRIKMKGAGAVAKAYPVSNNGQKKQCYLTVI